MKAKSILEKLNNNIENINYIHYSCQNLSDDNEGFSPRITSIAVLHHFSDQMYSFSMHLIAEEMGIDRNEITNQYDTIESKMLERFYDFARNCNPNTYWIHWNMNNINFGFETIEHRYRVLTKNTPFSIKVENRFNLSSILKLKYGSDYAKHPMMTSLMELNSDKGKAVLIGAEEVSAFKANEFIKLHNSTMSKVYFFRSVFNKMNKNKLRTERNGFKFWVRELYQSPIIQILSIVGILGSLISLFSLLLGG